MQKAKAQLLMLQLMLKRYYTTEFRLTEKPGMQGFNGGPVFIGVKDRMLTMPIPETLIMRMLTATVFN